MSPAAMTTRTLLSATLILTLALVVGAGACTSKVTPDGGGSGDETTAAASDGTLPVVGSPAATDGVPTYTYKIVHRYPHDRGAYTQGLLFHDGSLYESTGRPRESSLREIELKTGKILRRHDLSGELFGEGLTLWKGLLIQLTWHAKVAIVYDRRNFQELYRKSYVGEGWGLTHDGSSLIMSDGTYTLSFLDPATFDVQRKLRVTLAGRTVWDLNELEYIEGEIWANIYQDETIVRIDPKTGRVTGRIDLRGLQKQQGIEDRAQDVLNGIAYDPKTKRIFITGKYWPNLYEIELVLR